MEREKRHQRRLSKIRRESGASAGHHERHDSSRNSSIICTKRQSVASTGTLEEEAVVVRQPPNKSESMVTTFHLGIVFILLGFIMILSSMIPSSIIKADWSQLLGVGVAFIFIGLLMVMVNRIITAREEEELSQYVKQRLSRTRSGQPYKRDSECGNIVVPDIVKPPAIPSAMKGGSGHPPRSPKDKVTFAEFTDVCVTNTRTDDATANRVESAESEQSSSSSSTAAPLSRVDSCNNSLEVPSSEIITASSPTSLSSKVTILETISEHPSSSSSSSYKEPRKSSTDSCINNSETARLLSNRVAD